MRRMALAVVIALAVAACGGDGDAAGPTEAPASPDDATGESANVPAVNLGWVITGPDGTEFDIAETVTSNGGDITNSYTYSLAGGQPRQSLYTQFVDAVRIDVTVTSGGPVVVDLVRGTLADDGFSVDVVETIESQDVAVGASASMSATR